MPSCTPNDLMVAAAPLRGIPQEVRQLVIIYLLQQIAGLEALTPDELTALAKCYCGIDERVLKQIEVALLCRATGGVPPCPPSCDFQNMQIAWTPTNLKLGEKLGIVSGEDTGATSIISTAATLLNGVDLENQVGLLSASFPNLTACNGLLYSPFILSGCTALTTVSAPLLTSIHDDLGFTGCTSLATLNLTLLQNCGTNGAGNSFDLTGCSVLTTLNLPALQTIYADLSADNCTILTTASLGTFSPINGNTVSFQGCSLNAASVNDILARAVANAGYVSGGINLSGGFNHAPTGQGIADKATLNGRQPGLAGTN